jgi:hypothetical protein
VLGVFLEQPRILLIENQVIEHTDVEIKRQTRKNSWGSHPIIIELARGRYICFLFIYLFWFGKNNMRMFFCMKLFHLFHRKKISSPPTVGATEMLNPICTLFFYMGPQAGRKITDSN